jgi:hypothetical protein
MSKGSGQTLEKMEQMRTTLISGKEMEKKKKTAEYTITRSKASFLCAFANYYTMAISDVNSDRTEHVNSSNAVN